MQVLLTRPQEASDALAARLAAKGYRPLVAPVIAIAALPVTLPAGPFDGLLATSAPAFMALSALDRDTLRHQPVHAVGATTARAARAAGFTDVRIAGGEGASLRTLLRLTHPRPARLLYLAGNIRKPELEAGLVADGHAVTAVATYEARAVPWSAAVHDRLRTDPPGAVLHFSRRSATLMLEAARNGGLEGLLVTACHLCLSADVAAALDGLPGTRVVVAARPETESLLQALDASVAD